MSKFDLIKDFSYPDPDDLNLLSKIFKKREFYYYNVEKRKKLESYDEIQKYRDLNCKKDIKEPKEHQQLIKNFINPNTPYGVSGLTSFGTQPTVFYISGPEPVECLSLGGPFTGVVVGDQENWQNVTQIWEDDGVTPFVGGNNWYAVDPELNTSMGTTLKINNCGQVVGFYAC